MFPIEYARPTELPQYNQGEQVELELAVAGLVAELLGRYGDIGYFYADVSINPKFPEDQTYEVLVIEPYDTTDGGKLKIGQCPDYLDGVRLEPGAHSVVKEDADGIIELSLTVWDPAVETRCQVVGDSDYPVGRFILQELFEALTVILDNESAVSEAYDPPHATAQFPARYYEPMIERVMEEFGEVA